MKTKFQGKPLIELPENIPQIGFIEGDFGKEFLSEYQGRVEKDYQNNQVLRVLQESNDLITGSNSFAVVLANQILSEQNLRTATQADLEKTLKLEVLNLRGTYEDTGLVLSTKLSTNEPNSYLARDLTRQLKARNSRVKYPYPVLLNLTDLELRVDQNSQYGLAFDLKEDAKPIYAAILNKAGNFNSEDINRATGIPKKTGSEGQRYLYARDSGLSILCLDSDINLNWDEGDLALSYSVNRVVVVSAKSKK